MLETRIKIGDRATVPGGEINVKRMGSGPTLMLIHGFPLSSGMWKNQIEELANKFEIVAPDLRGFGKSSHLVEGWQVEDFADDLAMVVQLLEIKSLIFCGLSLGGYIGFELLVKYPELVSQMVLCNTRASADDEINVRGRKLMAERVRREGPGFVRNAMLPRLLAKQNSGEKFTAGLQGFFEGLCPDSIALTQLAMANRKDFSSWLERLNVPVTVVAGDCDMITPASEMEQMAYRIPGAAFHVISNAGHLTPLENRKEFNQLLCGLLSCKPGTEA